MLSDRQRESIRREVHGKRAFTADRRKLRRNAVKFAAGMPGVTPDDLEEILEELGIPATLDEIHSILREPRDGA